jgi:hypothetical protein
MMEAATQKTAIFILAAVGTSQLTILKFYSMAYKIVYNADRPLKLNNKEPKAITKHSNNMGSLPYPNKFVDKIPSEVIIIWTLLLLTVTATFP